MDAFAHIYNFKMEQENCEILSQASVYHRCIGIISVRAIGDLSNILNISRWLLYTPNTLQNIQHKTQRSIKKGIEAIQLLLIIILM